MNMIVNYYNQILEKFRI